MRPQAVCTFALCSLSSKNPDGLSCLGCIAIALASLQFAIKLILGLMSTMTFIGADFFTFLFGLYYGTGLQRAAKVSKQQAARASNCIYQSVRKSNLHVTVLLLSPVRNRSIDFGNLSPHVNKGLAIVLIRMFLGHY